MNKKQKQRNWSNTKVGDLPYKSLQNIVLASIFLFNLASALLKLNYVSKIYYYVSNKLKDKRTRNIAIILIVLSVYIPYVLAATVSHPASAIYNGTFAGGSYYFPANLTVNNTDLHVDSTTGRVGIGTTTPTAKLDVAGNASFSGNITQRMNDIHCFAANCTAYITYNGTSLIIKVN